MLVKGATVDRTFDSSPPGQNVRHFADDVFRSILWMKKIGVLIIIVLKYVPYGPIDNSPAWVYIMVWRRIGDKTYLNQCSPDSLTHICGTRGDELTHCCLVPWHYHAWSDQVPLKNWPKTTLNGSEILIFVSILNKCGNEYSCCSSSIA